MPKKEVKAFDFEGAMRELETLVARMEGGDLSLEESLKQFERGIVLTRACQKALSAAEQKIKILSVKDGISELRDFEPVPPGSNDVGAEEE